MNGGDKCWGQILPGGKGSWEQGVRAEQKVGTRSHITGLASILSANRQGQAGIRGADGRACARPVREADAGQRERAETAEVGQARSEENARGAALSEADSLPWTRHALLPVLVSPTP